VKPKERVLATIRNDPVDRVPVHHLNFSGYAAEVILGRKDVWTGGEHSQWVSMNKLWEGEDAYAEWLRTRERDAVELQQACGHDMLRVRYWPWTRRPTRRIDEHTFLFGDPDGEWFTMTYDPELELLTRREGVAGHEKPVSLSDLDRPPDEDALRREVEKAEARAEQDAPDENPYGWLRNAIERHPDYMIRAGGGTVFVDMRSQTQLMEAALWPDLFARKLMAQARWICKTTLPWLGATGLEVNVSGMDFCSPQGPSISPGLFGDVVAPALKLIVDESHLLGMRYFYASDGNFWPVADQLFDVIGIDGWFETDKSSGMDIRRLRERYPRLTIQGNIRVQVLHMGTREDVVRDVTECLEAAHEVGGVICGTSNMIMPGTPPQNIHAMLETIEKCR
jgi:hypothetical protein